MASAKHHLSLPGAPLTRRAGTTIADRDPIANRDHGRLMPWLMLAAALLAVGTASFDAGPAKPAATAAAPAAPDAGQGALILHAATRAALADAVGGF